MADRKDEIIKLQMDVINQMTQSNLRRIADDLYGNPGRIPDLQMPGDPTDPLDLLKSLPQVPAPDQPAAAKPADVPKKTEEKEAAAEEDLPENIDDLKAELNGYIGLDAVKQEVNSLINLVTIQQLRRENGLPVKDLSLHMVFSGNPGTGKTMIARLMARIYKSLGILSKGHLVEVDRSGLVAGYVGQTAIKTDEVIQKAMGGVLFVDEAYALTNHDGNDYGQEAVDTLLKAMEDHRDDLIVIVAGYTQLMEDFIHSNPGLESRFNRKIVFPDYTVAEMCDIFDMDCRKGGYVLADNARDLLRTLLAWYSLDISAFGNARGVRNLFERSMSAQADRLASDPDITKDELMTLTIDDLRKASGIQGEQLDQMTEKAKEAAEAEETEKAEEAQETEEAEKE